VVLTFLHSVWRLLLLLALLTSSEGNPTNRWELLRRSKPTPYHNSHLGSAPVRIHAYTTDGTTDQRVILTNQEFAIGTMSKTSPMKMSLMMTSKRPFL